MSAQISGRLRKMATQHQDTVAYQLRLADGQGNTRQFPLNHLLGQTLSLHFSGDVFCIHCERKTSRSFSQGYCYPCFKKLAQCDTCMVRPETCHYQQGTCREPEWATHHCFQPHLIYLANTTGLKVGITRETNMPTRWMDQGAVAALPLFRVNNRLDSGRIETTLAESIRDKTAWQAMLKNQLPELDLQVEAQSVVQEYEARLNALPNLAYQRLDMPVKTFHYPVLSYPTRVKSLNPEKQPHIEGQLMGIKGQYLLLDTGVINLRKYAGYVASFSGI